jgi:hypothetical protein
LPGREENLLTYLAFRELKLPDEKQMRSKPCYQSTG